MARHGLVTGRKMKLSQIFFAIAHKTISTWAGTGQDVSVVDNLPGDSARFYRVSLSTE